MKVLKHIRDNVYEVEMEFEPSCESRNWSPSSKTVRVCHDYIEFRGSKSIEKSMNLHIPNTNGCSNYASIPTSLQIDIRTFKDLIPLYGDCPEF